MLNNVSMPPQTGTPFPALFTTDKINQKKKLPHERKMKYCVSMLMIAKAQIDVHRSIYDGFYLYGHMALRTNDVACTHFFLG
jgi:hypothetical protein